MALEGSTEYEINIPGVEESIGRMKGLIDQFGSTVGALGGVSIDQAAFSPTGAGAAAACSELKGLFDKAYADLQHAFTTHNENVQATVENYKARDEQWTQTFTTQEQQVAAVSFDLGQGGRA